MYVFLFYRITKCLLIYSRITSQDNVIWKYMTSLIFCLTTVSGVHSPKVSWLYLGTKDEKMALRTIWKVHMWIQQANNGPGFFCQQKIHSQLNRQFSNFAGQVFNSLTLIYPLLDLTSVYMTSDQIALCKHENNLNGLQWILFNPRYVPTNIIFFQYNSFRWRHEKRAITLINR